MSASDHLSRSLFHGTSAQLNIGDVLEPRSMNYVVGDKAVFAATEPELAKHYAYEKMAINKSDTGSVYQVEPVDAEEQLTSLKGGKYLASKKGFRILGIHETTGMND
jgi:hypothetical protein